MTAVSAMSRVWDATGVSLTAYLSSKAGMTWLTFPKSVEAPLPGRPATGSSSLIPSAWALAPTAWARVTFGWTFS